jgi:hypothetical protein
MNWLTVQSIIQVDIPQGRQEIFVMQPSLVHEAFIMALTHAIGVFTSGIMLDSWIRQLESDVRNCELQCYRAYKHTWSPMSETKEH